MQLRKIVIHQLAKDAMVSNASLKPSNQCLDHASLKPQTLNTKLYQSFDHRNNKIDYAVFQENENFPTNLSAYLDSEQNNSDFLTFSVDVLNELLKQIKGIVPAKGGYFVFSECEANGRSYICIFLVRDTKGEIFTDAGEFLDIDEVMYANTDKLAMACRINLGFYQRNEGKPLTIINKKSKEVSEYFSRWLGASDRETSEVYSEQLYKIVSTLEPPINPNSPSGEKFTIDEMRKRVFEIIKTDLQGMIDVNTISRTIYGDENLISEHIRANEIELPTEFKAYTKTMKKFVQIRVSNDGFLLQFSRGDRRKIVIDNDSVTINSKVLADNLRQQIQEIDN
jgi:nucleoid-associated protein